MFCRFGEISETDQFSACTMPGSSCGLIFTTSIQAPSMIEPTRSLTLCQPSAFCCQMGSGATFFPMLMLMRDEMECSWPLVVPSPAQASSLGISVRFSQGFLHLNPGFAALRRGLCEWNTFWTFS